MDFYIYRAGDFDPALLAMLDRFSEDVQISAGFVYPFWRAEVWPGVYVAGVKWKGWEILWSDAGRIKSAMGLQEPPASGVMKAIGSYQKIPPSESKSEIREEKRREQKQAVADYGFAASIAAGLNEDQAEGLSIGARLSLAGVLDMSRVRIKPLTLFLLELNTTNDEEPEVTPGKIEDFNRWIDAKTQQFQAASGFPVQNAPFAAPAQKPG